MAKRVREDETQARNCTSPREGVLLLSNNTLSISMFRNEPVLLETASEAKHRERGQPVAEKAQNGLPLRLSYYDYMF